MIDRVIERINDLIRYDEGEPGYFAALTEVLKIINEEAEDELQVGQKYYVVCKVKGEYRTLQMELVKVSLTMRKLTYEFKEKKTGRIVTINSGKDLKTRVHNSARRAYRAITKLRKE